MNKPWQQEIDLAPGQHAPNVLVSKMAAWLDDTALTIEQLAYTSGDVTTSNDDPPTMIIMVDDEMLQKYKKDKSIPLAQVVDSCDIHRFEAGKSGKLVTPFANELQETFGTTRDDEIVKFMLNNGTPHGKAFHKPPTTEHKARSGGAAGGYE